MSKPKRHHFLPEFYLKGFTVDDLLWVYDRKQDEYRRQSPENTTVIKHYYSVETTEDKQDPSIEKMLSEFEGCAKSGFVKLERRDALSPKERADLACFLGLLFTRIPKFEREIDQIADATFKHVVKHQFQTLESVAAYLKQENITNLTPESMFDFIQKERFYLQGNRNNTIQHMLDMASKVSKEIFLMNWIVVHAHSETAFVTTDNPVGFVIPDHIRQTGEPALGAASDLVTKVVPLSGRIGLLIGGFGGGFAHANLGRREVREFNIMLTQECERFVIAHDRTLLQTVVQRSRVNKENCGTILKVEHVPHPNDPARTYMVVRRICPDAVNAPLKMGLFDSAGKAISITLGEKTETVPKRGAL